MGKIIYLDPPSAKTREAIDELDEVIAFALQSHIYDNNVYNFTERFSTQSICIETR